MHPVAVGRVVEVRVTQHEVVAVTRDGQVVARHGRSFTPHRTITAAEHGRAIRELREGTAEREEPAVEIRDLATYDRLFAVEASELPGLLVQAASENGCQALPEAGPEGDGPR